VGAELRCNSWSAISTKLGAVPEERKKKNSYVREKKFSPRKTFFSFSFVLGDMETGILRPPPMDRNWTGRWIFQQLMILGRY